MKYLHLQTKVNRLHGRIVDAGLTMSPILDGCFLFVVVLVSSASIRLTMGFGLAELKNADDDGHQG